MVRTSRLAAYCAECIELSCATPFTNMASLSGVAYGNWCIDVYVER